jgi:hypothetical protein
VVHIHQACITEDTQGSISHRTGRKTITNTGGQERIKLKRETDELMRVGKNKP